MIFSVTERGTFRRCERQAVLTSKNGQHLTPLLTPLNLSVGSLMHAAFQFWLLDESRSLVEHALDASVKLQAKVRERYKKQVGVYPKDSEMLETHEAIDFALAMCENYQLRWGSPLPKGYKCLMPEQKLRIPVPGTEHKCRECNSLPAVDDDAVECKQCFILEPGVSLHILEGRLDALLQHESGRVDILEHKTYGKRPDEWSLKTTDQFLAYEWMVKQLGVNHGVPAQIAYDGIWRRMKVPRGRKFEDMFFRVLISRTEAELDEFSWMLPLELNAMAALYAAPEKARINRPWNGCWDCKMDGRRGVGSLCAAMSRNEDTAGIIKSFFTTRDDDLDEDDTAGDDNTDE